MLRAFHLYFPLSGDEWPDDNDAAIIDRQMAADDARTRKSVHRPSNIPE